MTYRHEWHGVEKSVWINLDHWISHIGSSTNAQVLLNLDPRKCHVRHSVFKHGDIHSMIRNINPLTYNDQGI